ncbi:MAG TPA: ABC transporter permease [Bacteroidota bacterium]|nr:ABC transporter permease [Bacteroidota bacterium]
MSFQRILAILKKEFGQLFKDKKLLPIVFVAPVLQLTLLGFAASVDVKNIAMVLCDLDKTEDSRQLAEKFVTSGYFTIEYATDDYNAVQSYLDDNKVSMGLIIPHNFGNKLLRREQANVQLLVDGSEGNTSAIGLNYATQIVAQYSNRILTEVSGGANRASQAGIATQVRAWYNPDLKSRNYMVPGVLVLLLLVTTMNLTSMAVVREKEIGTLEQIMVTPIRPSEMIIGKLIPFTLIAIVNATIVLLVMVFGFDIPIKGSVPLLIGLSTFFLLTTLGLGLFVSTITRTQQQAMMIGQFFILQPMMYLSGFTFPVDNMPPILQFISFGIPMRHYLVIVRSLILKGVGISDLWLQALLLMGMGAGVLGASILRFKKKLD